MSVSLSAMRGGQPSSTAPNAGPWLSPQVVKRKTRPNVFQLMQACHNAIAACVEQAEVFLLKASVADGIHDRSCVLTLHHLAGVLGQVRFSDQDCVPCVPSCWNWRGKKSASPLASAARLRQEQTMIAKISGRLDETGDDWAIVDVQGVGYLVHCSTKTLAALGEVGEACTVHTDLQVSENDMRLLGFAESAERDWFRLLTQVQGVGSKVALAILSALSTGEVRDACAGGDAAMVARANGVGPKLAGRIVNELKDKAGALPGGGMAGVAGVALPKGRASADAVSALENLGFKPATAAQAVARAHSELGQEASESELIRVALKRAAG